MKLRPYQQEAVNNTIAYLRATRERDEKPNPIIELPTGAGKSIVLAELIRAVAGAGGRVLLLTHVKELIEQNAEKFSMIAPEIPHGIYSAGLDKRQTLQRVIFAGIQSVYDKAEDLTRAGAFHLVIIDEVHLCPQKDTGMYRQLLRELSLMHPRMRIVGLTATPYRLDGGLLTTGEDKIFHTVVYRATVSELIKDGYLSPVVTPSADMLAHYNMSKVSQRGGDYVASELAAAIDEQDAITIKAIDQVVSLGKDRKSWLLFASSVRHAERIVQLLFTHGITSALVTGETPMQERSSAVRRFRDGSLRAIVNVAVFTTGFDAPNVDLIALLRPTQSTALYVQCVGRGTRLAEGKTDCLLLDFGENIKTHGPVDAVKPKIKKQSESKVTTWKTCPKCLAEVIAGSRVCDECGFIFPQIAPDRTKTATADTSAALSSQVVKAPPETIKITRVAYGEHPGKNGKPPTLRADYYAGALRVVSEYICIEHDGYARAKALKWLADRQPENAPNPNPRTVMDALSARETWRMPTRIELVPDGDYKRVSAVLEWSPYPTPSPTENEAPTASQTPKTPIATPTHWTTETYRESMRAGEDWWAPST